MNKARVRAGLEARRLEAARLLQIGVEPPEVARRLKVNRTSVWRWKQAFAANRRSDRGMRSWRGGALRKAPRYLAAAAADRRREEAIGRSARSRRLGPRICHRSVDAGARGQAHREDQLQAVFGIGCVAAHQEIELFLPAAERSREASAAANLHWKKKRRPTLKKRRERRPNHRLHRRVQGERTASPRSDLCAQRQDPGPARELPLEPALGDSGRHLLEHFLQACQRWRPRPRPSASSGASPFAKISAAISPPASSASFGIAGTPIAAASCGMTPGAKAGGIKLKF